MIAAFFLLIACELVGEIIRAAFDLPVPGPVVGMFCLAAVLACRRNKPDAPAIPEALNRTAETLINQMPLLFVPAGVGIIAEAGLLRQEWLPILGGLIGSTVLSLVATGLIMHWTTPPRREFRSLALYRRRTRTPRITDPSHE